MSFLKQRCYNLGYCRSDGDFSDLQCIRYCALRSDGSRVPLSGRPGSREDRDVPRIGSDGEFGWCDSEKSSAFGDAVYARGVFTRTATIRLVEHKSVMFATIRLTAPRMKIFAVFPPKMNDAFSPYFKPCELQIIWLYKVLKDSRTLSVFRKTAETRLL